VSEAAGVSVVIPNLDSPQIDRVLGALRAQTLAPLEVLVVGRDRPGLVREDALVRLVSAGEAASPARNRNMGARAARGAIVCYTDADCIARPDWIARLVERHAAGARVVGGGVAVEPGDYWRLCDNLVSFAPFLETSAPGPRPYLPSLNFSVRRELLLELGGFDERFPLAAGEDTDLSFRLRQAGHTLWFEPRAAVAHRPPRTSAAAVWAHLRAFGRVHVGLSGRHGAAAAPRLSPRLAPLAGAIAAAAPLLALWDVLALYRADPALRRYWRALPGVVWGKIGWYWGVVEALMVHASVSRV